MNKEIDWHGVSTHLFKDWNGAAPNERSVNWLRVGNRLAYVAGGEGAWPKAIFPEPACGWDERDALV